MLKRDLLITNGRIISDAGIIYNKEIFVSNGKIVKIGLCRASRGFEGALRIDAKDNFVAPGFIDIHIHGNPSVISKNQAHFGTTSFLKALSTGEIHSINKIPEEIKSCKYSGAKLLGLYLEGPFISKLKSGAQDKRFIFKPELKLIESLFKKAPGLIKIVTIAPELKGADKLIKVLLKKGCVVSLGHTDADFKTAQNAFRSGAKLATHLFNAMRPISARDPGIAAEALLNKNVYCEVILDGAHIYPELFKLIFSLKGPDKIILVTDSIKACDLKARRIKKYNNIYKLLSGVIAGSSLTPNIALKNSILFGGVNLEEAIKFVTINPAKLLGIDRFKGSISPGKDADIVIFDKKFDVKKTIVEGKIVYAK